MLNNLARESGDPALARDHRRGPAGARGALQRRLRPERFRPEEKLGLREALEAAEAELRATVGRRSTATRR